MSIKNIKAPLLILSIACMLGLNSYANGGIGRGITLVLPADQFPASLKKYNATKIYLLYWAGSTEAFKYNDFEGPFHRGDTITNFKKFSEAAGNNLTGYRLIYERNNSIDSVWQLDLKYRTTYKAYDLDNDLLHIFSYDSTMKKTDEFVFDYGQKIDAMSHTRGRSDKGGIKLEWLMRQYQFYSSYDRNNYAQASVWILSIGIDDYGAQKYRTCKSDARSYTEFFKKQFRGSVHEYTLLDKDATRSAILAALKDIARQSSFNDYFIFNFSGCSNLIKNSPADGTHFFPYDVVVTNQAAEGAGIKNRDARDTTGVYRNCISLRTLQEYIQAIPANNQLFISEAGPSGEFKTEFIKILMQNSPEVASILNKNRIIIVPNGFGLDGVYCQGNAIQKGPINYYITSLDSANIYDLFKEDYKANQVAYRIKNKAWNCNSSGLEYFDIFFEKKFLKDYKDIFEDAEGGTRGLKPKSTELKKTANLQGKQYALVVGTDNYTGGWKKLPNAINDARAIRDELVQDYGFEVQLLEDKPMDTIYKAIGEYYHNLQPADQLIIYFAGHGDMEREFMDDGFIVCSDSKARENDLTRNSYIQYVKLQKMINKIPARQILLMLDVCHGGTFNQKRSDPVKTITNRNILQFLVDQSQFTCRKFLSSVGTDEAFDGKPGDHSPFANLLLQVLRARGDNSNGIVTLSNIFSVLQTASMNETATLKISPQRDGFGKDNPESDFILIPVEKPTAKK